MQGSPMAGMTQDAPTLNRLTQVPWGETPAELQ
jgi:hypothetical protein